MPTRGRNPDEPLLFRWRRAIVNDGALTAADRHVALTLALHMDLDGGSCYPSLRLVAHECARKAHTVSKSVQTLETTGYLDVKRGVKKGAKGWSSDVNRYFAQMPLRPTAPVAPRGISAVAPSVTQQLPQGAHKLHKSSANVAASSGATSPVNDTDWMTEAVA